MDGIIFDVDGTLWDATDTIAKAWNQTIAENSTLKMQVSGSDLRAVFGKTMDEITEIFFPSLPYEERTRLGYLCFDSENQLLEKEPAPLYPGVEETFQKLSKKTDLFIVSNCQKGYIEILLQTTGLSRYVKDHLCFGDTQVPKHETIRLLMKKNQLNDVIYVGDTQGDFHACKLAGVPFIFAEYGFGAVPDAPRKITDITQLIDLI
ncbi:HAD family hydrolase [Roseburia hominis]